MIDDVEPRLRRALSHVAPTPGAAADLADALATAERASVPPTHRPLWVGVAAAAVLIAAVGYVALRREPDVGPPPKPIVAAPLDGHTVRVHVDGDGVVVLDDLRGAPLATVELGGTPTRASDGLDVLERALVELTSLEPRNSNGTSPIALELVPSPKARWRWIQWTMQAAAHPRVQMVTMRFGVDGGVGPLIDVRLPLDRGVGSGVPVEPMGLKVTVLAGARGGFRIRLAGTESAWDVDLDSSPAPSESKAVGLARATSELSSSIRTAAAGDTNGVFGEIEVPPPGGDGVTYEIVLGVIRAFREAGIDDVRFGGAARPKLKEGTSAR